MKTYLVGGAVRDRLLGRTVKERDWVVVGATPESMLAQGFRPIGQDFPVFLHPTSNEEYALARTERKSAPGYHGFTFHAAPDVPLEQDLARRDLTINAMAEDEDGTLIDPFGGRQDLQRRLLRHVSPAFAEDPVRILRVARFAARYDSYGFSIADETLQLMRDMVAADEVAALVPERVWQEMAKALTEPRPRRFIEVLRNCGALAVIFPEIDRLWGIPQPAQWHPEIDTGIHTLLVLDQVAVISEDPVTRFAALLHDLGKGVTPKEQWPSHKGHELAGVPIIEALCARLRVPKVYQQAATLVSELHLKCHQAAEMRPAKLHDMLVRIGAFQHPQRLRMFTDACTADARGRTGLEDQPYPQAALLHGALAAAQAVTTGPLLARGLKGKAVGEALRHERCDAISAYLKEMRGLDVSLAQTQDHLGDR